MDLFDYDMNQQLNNQAPLAAKMRPKKLDEYIGQKSIIGEGKLLRRAIESDRLFSSIIFFGPPGTGKTTLAKIIAQYTDAHFETISAVLAGVADLRKVIAEATERRKMYRQRTILFVDEVHRWNKAQQDALLPHVETGLILLIGATTENPYFQVIPALVSRSRIFELKPLHDDELAVLLDRAIHDKERGYGSRNILLDKDARDHLLRLANGDARNLYNALELAVESTDPNVEGVIHIDAQTAQDSIQKRVVVYGKNGDAHYDTVSAFIKSVRGSDVDAALYWLAKMIKAGEDSRFILRRLLVLASEDIGMADPQALVVVSAALQSFEFIGMPEGVFPLTQATIYLATAPKSNSTLCIYDVMAMLEEEGDDEIPIHLMDSNRDSKGLGHGKGYQYPHSFEGHFTPQQYMPNSVAGKQFYKPSDQGYENQVVSRVERIREMQQAYLARKNGKDK
ncbi:MAG: AAA family ATPase [Anaerolineaceae bacterium]|nr:AAA family ATPase [Anaerolineaceae bacterium]